METDGINMIKLYVPFNGITLTLKHWQNENESL